MTGWWVVKGRWLETKLRQNCRQLLAVCYHAVRLHTPCDALECAEIAI